MLKAIYIPEGSNTSGDIVIDLNDYTKISGKYASDDKQGYYFRNAVRSLIDLAKINSFPKEFNCIWY